MLGIKALQKSLRVGQNPKKAQLYAHFFKTAPGQYGHGDIFLGLTVPEQRKIAKKFYHLSLADIQKLLASKIHEERFTALVILSHQFQHTNEQTKKQIYTFYLNNAKRINNWDLVDTSAPRIVGMYLLNKPRAILYKLAHSSNLWERRISIIATLALIQNGEYEDTLKITQILLSDTHDLIHKACGWMLREVGKKSVPTLKKFLNHHAHHMPRTMLRYSIEKFSKSKRQQYLKK